MWLWKSTKLSVQGDGVATSFKEELPMKRLLMMSLFLKNPLYMS